MDAVCSAAGPIYQWNARTVDTSMRRARPRRGRPYISANRCRAGRREPPPQMALSAGSAAPRRTWQACGGQYCASARPPRRTTARIKADATSPAIYSAMAGINCTGWRRGLRKHAPGDSRLQSSCHGLRRFAQGRQTSGGCLSLTSYSMRDGDVNTECNLFRDSYQLACHLLSLWTFYMCGFAG